jgi:uncharacterized membrane protein
MKLFFTLFGILLFGIAILLFVGSRTALHEIEALILFLASTVLVVGGFVIEAIDKTRR